MWDFPVPGAARISRPPGSLAKAGGGRIIPLQPMLSGWLLYWINLVGCIGLEGIQMGKESCLQVDAEVRIGLRINQLAGPASFDNYHTQGCKTLE